MANIIGTMIALKAIFKYIAIDKLCPKGANSGREFKFLDHKNIFTI